jgi:RNA polymerase sigma factor (sigma-70 family)
VFEGVKQRAQLAIIGKRFIDALTAPFEIDAATVHVRATIGMADYPASGSDLDLLLTNAEVALFAAKRSQRGSFRVYSNELSSQARREQARRAEIVALFATLTTREREVVQGLVAGKSNKSIAQWLGCSPRTVEAHRARIMEKMRMASLPDLVRVHADLGVS